MKLSEYPADFRIGNHHTNYIYLLIPGGDSEHETIAESTTT